MVGRRKWPGVTSSATGLPGWTSTPLVCEVPMAAIAPVQIDGRWWQAKTIHLGVREHQTYVECTVRRGFTG